MFEIMLSSLSGAPWEPPPVLDNTVFKGYVSNEDFITATDLAAELNLTAGSVHNSDVGWLHYITLEGLEFYLARKTLRYNLSWEQINTAQAGKTISINGEDHVVHFMTGAANPSTGATDSNAGGDWNNFLYPIYGGIYRGSLPGDTPHWSDYTDEMLGISADAATTANGSTTVCLEAESRGHYVRGYSANSNPNIMGVWYNIPSQVDFHNGWRPMVIVKSTLPVTPFQGEVAAASFITPEALATAVNLTAGASINTASPWMHFIDAGKEIYFPKLPIRIGISWEQLNTANLVTGNTTVVIGGRTFKVRLMLGSTASPGSAIGREWLNYMVGLTNAVHGTYTPAQLGVDGGSTNGQLTTCQEASTSGGHCAPGYPTIDGMWYQPVNSTATGYGWRPVLELVP
jgi:hypothetical protein